jgi:hypothetical protein
MLRFLATGILTLVGIVAAAAWWSGGDGVPIGSGGDGAAMRPHLETARSETRGEPVASAPDATTEPTLGERAPETPPTKPEPPRAATRPTLEPVEPLPAAKRSVPPVPAPVLASERMRRWPSVSAPIAGEEGILARSTEPRERAAETAIEETVLPDSPFFDPRWDDEAATLDEPLAPTMDEPLAPEAPALDEAGEEGRALAMRTDHDASAALIRRLLDVYEGLGRRP